MKNTYKIIITIVFLLCTSNLLNAQNNTIQGVVSENGIGLPGAVVSLVGTSFAVQTDLDGKYTIQATAGSTLEFSFLG